MRKYIKKLQSKSEDTRKLIFICSLIFCMSFISFIWIYNLGARFGNGEVKEQVNKDIKPFKLFSNSISDTYKNIGASVGNVPSLKNENVEVNNDNQIDLIPIEYNN